MRSSESSPKTARIITKQTENGAGLDADVEIYRNLLYRAGFSRVFHRCHADPPDSPNEPVVTLNLFLESIKSRWMRLARFNWFMVNQEIAHSTENYQYLDCIIAKTRHARDLVTWLRNRNAHRYRILYTKHTSRDVCMTGDSVRKDYASVIHVPGKSVNKNTDIVLEAWYRHPEWPTIQVVVRPSHHPYVSRYSRTPNVRLFTERVPDERLARMQMTAGLHVCTSEAEGWGHYLNEARGSGSVVMVTDGMPMNELFDDKSAILVPSGYVRSYSSVSKGLPGSVAYRMDIESIENGMSQYLSMSENQRREMGENARRRFLEDTEYLDSVLVPKFMEIDVNGSGLWIYNNEPEMLLHKPTEEEMKMFRYPYWVQNGVDTLVNPRFVGAILVIVLLGILLYLKSGYKCCRK